MEIGTLSLVIFIFCVALFIWDRLPMATTAVLGCVLMVIFKVCDFKTAFGQFSSSTVMAETPAGRGMMRVRMSPTAHPLSRRASIMATAFSTSSRVALLVTENSVRISGRLRSVSKISAISASASAAVSPASCSTLMPK